MVGSYVVLGATGDFHPSLRIYLSSTKCNLDAGTAGRTTQVKGMTEDVARRSIDWLHDNGCRVLALMAESRSAAPISCTKSSTTREKRLLVLHRHKWAVASARGGGSAW